jgi:uncharacterized protein YfaT (DUF1175 family)
MSHNSRSSSLPPSDSTSLMKLVMSKSLSLHGTKWFLSSYYSRCYCCCGTSMPDRRIVILTHATVRKWFFPMPYQRRRSAEQLGSCSGTKLLLLMLSPKQDATGYVRQRSLIAIAQPIFRRRLGTVEQTPSPCLLLIMLHGDGRSTIVWMSSSVVAHGVTFTQTEMRDLVVEA